MVVGVPSETGPKREASVKRASRGSQAVEAGSNGWT